MARLRFTLIFGIIFGVVAVASADEIQDYFNDPDLPLLTDGLQIKINKLIDKNIGKIQDALKKFDPSKLPNIPLLRKGKLSNGSLNKLSTIKRTGDCFLKYGGRALNLDVTVGWDIIKYQYDYDFKLWLIQRRGQLLGSVEKISVNLKLTVDFKNRAIVLERFKLVKIGKLGLELKGTIGDRIRSFVAKIIINLAKDFITPTVEGVASNAIEEKINEFNAQIPIDKPQFTYVDLVKMSRNRYDLEDNSEENYLKNQL